MGDSSGILWLVYMISAALYWWIGKYVAEPHFTPLILRTPGVGKALMLAPQIGLASVVILGFMLTDYGWRYLVAVVATCIILAPRLR